MGVGVPRNARRNATGRDKSFLYASKVVAALLIITHHGASFTSSSSSGLDVQMLPNVRVCVSGEAFIHCVVQVW